MAIENKSRVIETIKSCLRNKLENYRPETLNMPFHYRLLGRDRMALFSFIHSLNTTFGTSIYEPVAKELSEPHFNRVLTQHRLGDIITSEAQIEIQNILNALSVGETVDKRSETERIRRVAQKGTPIRIRIVKVDLFIESSNNYVYMFDLKTVKPNMTDFKAYKRTLLEWLAVYFYQHPSVMAHTLISIPYNPYEPHPYDRWTMKGMLDLTEEVKVAEEFWDFLAGPGTYADLLDCFEQAGIDLRPELDAYFLRFRS